MTTPAINMELQFESQISSNNELIALWNGFKISLQKAPISSGEAYQIFSTAHKITRIVVKIETLKTVWIDILNQRHLTVCRLNTSSLQYNFHAIVELAEKGEENFKIDIIEIDPKIDDVKKIALEIKSISAEATGISLDSEVYEGILNNANTFCLIAKHLDRPVGCLYASYVTVRTTNVLHFRFLGRKIEYPSIHFIQLLQQQEKRLRERFPNLHYFSLCVFVENNHALSRYHELGFYDVERIEKGFMGNPMMFLLKKLHQEDHLQDPTRNEINTAIVC